MIWKRYPKIQESLVLKTGRFKSTQEALQITKIKAGALAWGHKTNWQNNEGMRASLTKAFTRNVYCIQITNREYTLNP